LIAVELAADFLSERLIEKAFSVGTPAALASLAVVREDSTPRTSYFFA